MTGLLLWYTVMCCDADRLTAAPPAVSKAACLNDNIGEHRILYVTTIANLNGNTTVASADDTIIYSQILEISGTLGSNL